MRVVHISVTASCAFALFFTVLGWIIGVGMTNQTAEDRVLWEINQAFKSEGDGKTAYLRGTDVKCYYRKINRRGDNDTRKNKILN